MEGIEHSRQGEGDPQVIFERALSEFKNGVTRISAYADHDVPEGMLAALTERFKQTHA